ncbi:MAG: hypothetical protein QM704_11275 [Anaeromyxobacteraceae bacterium]
MSGSARMAGCMISGKLSAEKKTPERRNIGIITRLMRPETVCVFRARQATRSPSPLNASAPSVVTSASAASEPRTGTPNASTANPRKSGTSMTRKKSRIRRKEAR